MTVDTSRRVFIQEVSPRDGFQIEPHWIETADKIAFVNALSKTGLAKIEVSSFVSPKAVPSLRDAEEVFRRIDRHPGVLHVALVPNLRGAERAFAVGVDEINFVMSASETHNRANMRMSCGQSLEALQEILGAARSRPVRINCGVATAFGCPFKGGQSPDRVLGFVERYLWRALRLCRKLKPMKPAATASPIQSIMSAPGNALGGTRIVTAVTIRTARRGADSGVNA